MANYNIIPKNGDYRRKNTHIILTQMKNLKEINTVIDPDILRGSYFYTWGRWQQYFHFILGNRRSLPVHYYVELLDTDYVIYVGHNFQQHSYFLKDLTDMNLIPMMYRDAILIGINEDFELDIPDDRLYQHVSDKLLSSLMKEYGIEYTEVRFLDEILVNNWQDKIPNIEDNKFELRPHKYYDRVMFETIMRRFMKR